MPNQLTNPGQDVEFQTAETTEVAAFADGDMDLRQYGAGSVAMRAAHGNGYPMGINDVAPQNRPDNFGHQPHAGNGAEQTYYQGVVTD